MFRCYATIDDVHLAIRHYEEETVTKYVVVKTSKEIDLKATHHIKWSSSSSGATKDLEISFTGIPFIVGAIKIKACKHGPDRHVNLKEKNRLKRAEALRSDHPKLEKSRRNTQNTKKFDCPARIIIQEILYFPEFAADEDSTQYQRDQLSNRLRCKLSSDCSLTVDKKYYLSLPNSSNHVNHKTGKDAGDLQSIDRRIINKIHELVKDGIKTVDEMKRAIATYLRTLFVELPPKPNRRFYPTDRDIRNHMTNGRMLLMSSKNDQENLQELLNEWKSEEGRNFHYRPYRFSSDSSVDDDTLLLVIQTAEQKRLMGMYGNYMAMVDATYKEETSSAIEEALSIISSWNSSWKPQTLMMDNCAAELKAVRSCFQDSQLLLCDFHREQAWQRFLTKGSSKYDENHKIRVSTFKDEMLKLLRRIARSDTEDAYNANVKCLQEHPMFTDGNKTAFRSFINDNWLPTHKMWVWAYRKGNVLSSISTNNGTERINELFKYTHLKRNRNMSLYFMTRVMLLEFFPELYERLKNVHRCSAYRRYDPQVPEFLRDKPEDVTNTCLQRMHHQISISDVLSVGSKKFQVKQHTVFLGDDELLPNCTCYQWEHSSYPCVHMFAVFQHTDMSFYDLCTHYRSLPYLNLDKVVTSPLTGMDNEKDELALIPSGFSSLQKENESEQQQSKLDQSGQEQQTQMHITTSSAAHTDDNDSFKRDTGKCRELLKVLNSYTFQLSSSAFAAELKMTLEELVEKTRTNIHRDTENHLPSRPFLKRKSTNRMSSGYSNVSFDPPPNKRRKVNIYRNRTGSRADVMRTNYMTKNILLATAKNKLETAKNFTRIKAIGPLPAASSEPPPSCVEEHSQQLNSEILDDSVIQIEPVDPILNTSLHTKILDETYWLTDMEIDAALSLMSNQWPSVLTQSSLYTQRAKLFDYVGHGDYCQIIHLATEGHWVSVTNIRGRGKVRVFDSLGLKLSHFLQTAIASLEKSTSGVLKICSEPVQRQMGGSDCGLFSIANLVEVLTGGEPKKVYFQQTEMRKHFINCMINKCWSPFPKAFDSDVRRVFSNTLTVKIYCTCRMPYHRDDIKLEGMWMVQCCYCHEWYHRKCIKLDAIDIDPFTGNIDDEFICQKCKTNGKGFRGW